MTTTVCVVFLGLLLLFETISNGRRVREVEGFCHELSERNFKLNQRVGELERLDRGTEVLRRRVDELETWLPGSIETALDTADDSGTPDDQPQI